MLKDLYLIINNINCRIYLAFNIVIKSKNLKMMEKGKRKRLRNIQTAKKLYM